MPGHDQPKEQPTEPRTVGIEYQLIDEHGTKKG
jgi:hypothetical protein